jgi:potassium-transporting ATPase KdpC subunit
MRRQLIPAIISMVIFTVLLGLAYPLVVTGVAQVAFKNKADGSFVSVNGKKVGSSLLAQAFTNAKGNPIKKYFQERPSAANYDPTYSTGSNYGPLNPKLIGNDPGVNIDTKKNPYANPDDPTCVPVQSTDKAGNPKVDAKGNPIYDKNNDGTYACDPNTAPQRAIAYRKLNGLSNSIKIPVDAVTASASGLDPDISIANARLQAARVANARGLSTAQVLKLVNAHIDGRPLGFIGEKTVNVLDLNLALDALKS